MSTTPKELPAAETTALLRMPQVIALTGLGKSTLWNKIAAQEFPQPIRISTRARAFILKEVQDWIDERIRLSRQTTPGRTA